MSRKKYRIKLINAETGKGIILNDILTNRKKADDFVARWKMLGFPFEAEVIIEQRRVM